MARALLEERRIVPDDHKRASCLVVEAAHHVAASEITWVANVFDAWCAALETWGNVTAFAMHQGADGEMYAPGGADVVIRFLQSERTVDGYVHVAKTKDSVGVVVQPVPGAVLVLLARVDDGPIALDRHQRRMLERVGFQIESGYRLQHLGPRTVLAEVSKDGEISRFDGAIPDLWPTLVDGRASLVEAPSTGSRSYRVVSNPSHAQRLRALTTRERDILVRAARGDSAKSIAYGLDVSAPFVSNALASGALKIGVSTRTEVVRLAALLSSGERARLNPDDVTMAEREVLDLLREGLGNQEIARRRNRSIRTVANQVASLLRKTGRVSRRALAVP